MAQEKPGAFFDKRLFSEYYLLLFMFFMNYRMAEKGLMNNPLGFNSI